MDNYFQAIQNKLDKEINELSYENEDPIILSEKTIDKLLESLGLLKEFIVDKGFKNETEEILFFKELKPKILSKLIYYNALYKIETKKPHGSERDTKRYLNNELSKLKRFFDNNIEFYKYYRTNSTYLDHKYFIRENFDIKLSLDTYYFESDRAFSTTHDYKVAKIIANDLIQVYLEDQLLMRNKISANKVDNKNYTKLKWTGTKVALTELIYALHESKVFNDGKYDIKVLVNMAENILDVDLGNFYHTYLELRNRKINRTKFIDMLKEGLIRKMEEQDDRY